MSSSQVAIDVSPELDPYNTRSWPLNAQASEGSEPQPVDPRLALRLALQSAEEGSQPNTAASKPVAFLPVAETQQDSAQHTAMQILEAVRKDSRWTCIVLAILLCVLVVLALALYLTLKLV